MIKTIKNEFALADSSSDNQKKAGTSGMPKYKMTTLILPYI
jgi:hypothetical protein